MYVFKKPRVWFPISGKSSSYILMRTYRDFEKHVRIYKMMKYVRCNAEVAWSIWSNGINTEVWAEQCILLFKEGSAFDPIENNRGRAFGQ